MTSIPRRVVARVLERDGWRCVIAGPECTGVASVADHRAGRGMGGNPRLNVVEALTAACVLCNGWKEDATGFQRLRLMRRGVLVERATLTSHTLVRLQETPVRYPDGGDYLLTRDGHRKQVTPGFADELRALYVPSWPAVVRALTGIEVA